MNKSFPHQPVQNVGILAMEIYFPNVYVAQEDLEAFDQASKGKYTIGLGQQNMAFVNDREDINSISLTCLNNLLLKNHIDPKQVGRLEVGTETFVDKSKSVKTTLMQLFRSCGNHDIEGVTTTNACYGGTSALFNTINWVQSEAYDGRLGVVLCADLAVYPKGNARPTGGAGAIAMVIGPNANIVFDRVRATFIDDQYDFYKPVPNSEYPTVDGQLTIKVYLNALENCVLTFYEKFKKAYGAQPSLKDFDYFCFHTPFAKMVQKSYFHMLLTDVKANQHRYPQDVVQQLASNQFKPDQQNNSFLQKVFGSEWKDKCERTLYLSKNLGNIYTGSLYGGLLSLLCDPALNLQGKKVLMFSYGSGCAASLFLVRVNGDYRKIQQAAQFRDRLEKRMKVAPEMYDYWMAHRETTYGNKDYVPQGSIEHMHEGTYYLSKVDDKYRRSYSVKQSLPQVDQSLFLASHKLENSLHEGGRRLGQLHSHLSTTSAADNLDKSVLKKVVVNFHKKPIEE